MDLGVASANVSDNLDRLDGTVVGRASLPFRTPDSLSHDASQTGEYDRQTGAIFHALDRKSLDTAELQAKLSPGAYETFKAALQQHSPVGALASSESLFVGSSGAAISADEIVKRANEDGIGPYLSLLENVQTVEKYEAVRNDIKRELSNQQLLESQGLAGSVSSFLAALVDPTLAIPGGRFIKGVAQGSRLTNAVVAGADFAAQAAATEAALQSAVQTRDASDAVSGIATASVLGGILGATWKSVGPAVAARVEANVDGTISALKTKGVDGLATEYAAASKSIDEATGVSPKSTDGGTVQASVGSVGAARVISHEDAANVFGEVTNGRLGSYGLFEALEIGGTRKVATIPGTNVKISMPELVRDLFANPAMVLDRSPSSSARVARELLTLESAYTKTDVRGIAKPTRVADIVGEIEGSHTERIHQFQKLWNDNAKGALAEYKSFYDFRRAVGRAMASGDVDPNPVVEKAAKLFRETSDDLLKRAQAIGKLGEDAGQNLSNARSYVTTEYLPEKIREDKDAFIRVHTDAYAEDIRQQVREATDAKMRFEAEQAFDIARGIKKQRAAIESSKAQIIFEDRDLDKLEVASYKIAGDALAGKLDTLDAAYTKTREEISAKLDSATTAARAKANQQLVPGLTADKRRLINAVAREEISKAETAAHRAHGKNELDYQVKETALRRDGDKEYARIESQMKGLRAKMRSEIKEDIDAANAEFRALKKDVLARDVPYDADILKYDTPAKIAARANELAWGTFNQVTGVRRQIMEFERASQHSITGNYRKARSNPTSHRLMMERGWANDDILDILDKAVKRVGSDIALGTIFQKPVKRLDPETGKPTVVMEADGNLTELKKRVVAEYRPLLDNLSGDALKRATVARDQDLKAIDALVARHLRRTRADDVTTAMQTATEGLKAGATLTRMGGTVVSSIMDPINVAWANGFSQTFKHGVVPFFNDFGAAWKNADGDLRKGARLTLANAESVIASTMREAAGIDTPFAQSNPGLSATRRMLGYFGKVSGIDLWNSLIKQMAYNTFQSTLLVNSLEGWGALSTATRTRLSNLGVSPELLERIKAQYNAQDVKTSAGIPTAKFWEWTDAEAASVFRAAIHNERHNMVISPRFEDKPYIFDSLGGQLIMQFKSYAFASQARLVGRNLQLTKIDGASDAQLRAYSAIGSMLFAAVLIDGLKQIMSNNAGLGGSVDPNRSGLDRVVDQWTKTPGEAMFNALDRSGLAWFAPMEFSKILENFGGPSLKGLASLPFDEKDSLRGSSRIAGRSPVESLLGPAAGLVADAPALGRALYAGAAWPFLGGSDDAPTFNRGDYKRATRYIPFGNTPLIQPILNEGQRYLGTQYDWAAPK